MLACGLLSTYLVSLTETPLTLATTLKEPAPVLAALVNGGAHLDFRALDGCTALHRAAQQNNLKALQVLQSLL